MSKTQGKVTFTAIPTGRVGDKLQLSIFVTPKLETKGEDADDPFHDWPNWVRNHLQFDIHFAKITNGAVDTSSFSTRAINGLRPADSNSGSIIYSELFAPAKVTPHSKPDPNIKLKTYDTKAASDCINNLNQELYKNINFSRLTSRRRNNFTLEVGVLSDRHNMLLGHVPIHDTAKLNKTAALREDANPNVSSAASSEKNVFLERDKVRVWRETEQLSATSMEDLKVSANRQNNPVQHRENVRQNKAPKLMNPLLGLRTFWSREQRTANTLASNLAKTEPYDFHQLHALMGHHPPLMEMLGFVLKIEVAAPTEQFSAVSVELVNNPLINAGASLQPQYCWTACTHQSFLPAAKDDKIIDGYLNLKNDDFFLEDKDIDGTSQKFLQTLEALYVRHKEDVVRLQAALDDPEEVVPPPQRTLGLSLVQSMRDAEIETSRRAMADAEDGKTANPIFYAEDLVRGYVVDLCIKDDDGGRPATWFPLCARDEHYFLNDKEVLTRIDGSPALVEGSIKPPSHIENTKPENSAQPLNERYVLETLVQWTGRYLCVPVEKADAIPKGTDTDRHLPSQKPNSSLKSEVRLPSKTQQPPLRVGADYQMRARVEFISGDVVPFKDDQISAAPTLPNNKPWLKLRRYEPLAAPSICLIGAQGSKDDQQRALRQLLIISSGREGEITHHSDLRLIAPPRVIQRIAELHVGRDKGAEKTQGLQKLALDPKDGSLPAVASRFDDRTKLRIPYLPDPMAAEICAILFDQTTEQNDLPPKAVLPLYAFDSTDLPHRNWPDALINVLQLSATNEEQGSTIRKLSSRPIGYPGLDRDSRICEVSLPPAHEGILRVYSGFGIKDRLRLMALCESDSDSGLDEVMNFGHPMLNSTLDLRVVHAVQFPLDDPKPEVTKSVTPSVPEPGTTRRPAPLMLKRQQNTTAFEDKEFKIALDRKSTGSISLGAFWKEMRDNGKRTVGLSEGQLLLFTQHVPSAKEENYQVDPKSFTIPLHLDLGDTKYRRLQFRSTAVSRFVDEVGKPESECRIVSDTEPIDLLSTRRPDPPEILYAVPTFGWDNNAGSKQKPEQFYSKRLGAGLRIYMKAPWFSSGDGELLGVVVEPTEPVKNAMIATSKKIPFPIPEELATANTYLSAWGLDPVIAEPANGGQISFQAWDTMTEPIACPDAGAKTKTRSSESAAGPSDVDGACGWDIDVPPGNSQSGGGQSSKVAVIGYKPAFDCQNNLWYADIVFDRAPYFGTFIRLALVRYQPLSLPGFEISDIVFTDFAQLSPDRTVTVQRRKVACEPKGKPVDGLAIAIWGIPNSATRATDSEYRVMLEEKFYKETKSLQWKPSIEVKQIPNAPSDLKPEFPNGNGEKLIWYGEIDRQSCTDRLLVVQEYQHFLSDHWGKDQTNKFLDGKRLVYVDALQL